MFQISTRDDQPRTFHLVGELDLASIGELAQALTPSLAEPGDLVLDLSKLQFVDSTGIRAFLDVGRQLRGRGRLILESPSGAVRRVLDLMGLSGSSQTLDIGFDIRFTVGLDIGGPSETTHA